MVLASMFLLTGCGSDGGSEDDVIVLRVSNWDSDTLWVNPCLIFYMALFEMIIL